MTRGALIEPGKYSVLLGRLGVARFDRRPEDDAFEEEVRRIYGKVRIKSLHGDPGPRDDNRKEVRDAIPEVQKLARSVALICDSSELPGERIKKLQTSTIGLYQTERFHEQEAVYKGFTGFLVGENLLLTTQHGVEVPKLRVVFDYQLDLDGHLKKEFTEDEVFTVTEVVPHGNPADLLLLRLNRSPGRPYRAIDGKQAGVGTRLWMLGHPLGLPMKFVDEATITELGTEVFESNLDASDGNSGSMVLKDGSDHVIGVLKEASAALRPKDEDDPHGPQIWLWCREGENCSTSVISSPMFAPAVAQELANGRRVTRRPPRNRAGASRRTRRKGSRAPARVLQ